REIERTRRRDHRLDARRDLRAVRGQRELLGILVRHRDDPARDGAAIVRRDVAEDMDEPLRLDLGWLSLISAGERGPQQHGSQAQEYEPPAATREVDSHIQKK